MKTDTFGNLNFSCRLVFTDNNTNNKERKIVRECKILRYYDYDLDGEYEDAVTIHNFGTNVQYYSLNHAQNIYENYTYNPGDSPTTTIYMGTWLSYDLYEKNQYGVYVMIDYWNLLCKQIPAEVTH